MRRPSPGLDEELAAGLVDAVTLRELGRPSGDVRGPVHATVERPARDVVDSGRRVGDEGGDEAVDVVHAVSLVEPVALQHEPLTGHVLGGVVGRRAVERRAGTPSGSTGRLGGTAHKPVVRKRKSGTRLVRRRVSVLPLATAPASVVALPSSIFCAPTMSEKSGANGDSMAGVRMRSSACAKARAVTGLPSEKRASLRTVKVYVFPSRETTGSASASSGRRRRPSGSWLVGIAHERAARCAAEQVTAAGERRVDRVVKPQRRSGTCRPP